RDRGAAETRCPPDPARARVPDPCGCWLRGGDALPSAVGLHARTVGGSCTRLPLAAGGGATTGVPVKVVHVHRIGGIGGSERHLLTLLPALADRGLDVHFLGLDLAGGGPEPFYRELEAAGIEHERFPCPRDFHPFLAF